MFLPAWLVYALLSIFIVIAFKHRRVLEGKGFAFFSAGWIMNILVVRANDGLLPVKMDVVTDFGYWMNLHADGYHCALTDKTHLNFLADLFFIPTFGVVSIGDIVLLMGLFIVLAGLLYHNRIAREPRNMKSAA